MDSDERALVERARTNPSAFGELYDRHVSGVYRFVVSRVHEPALAEDITADVFLKALNGLPGYRYLGPPFSCWLYRIARNAVADHFRCSSAWLELPDSLPGTAPAPDERAILGAEIAEIWRLVDQLPPLQRSAMILKFREDRSLREVGAMTGRSEAAAKLLIHRALSRLRLRLAVAPAGGTASSALAAS